MVKKLNESSLSRLQQYLKNHDGVCISAWVSPPFKEDGESQHDYEDRIKGFNRKSKNRNSRMLLTELKMKHYTIISIKGFYQYDGQSKPDKENSFAVINTNNDKDFCQFMLDMAVEYNQESMLYIHASTYKGEYIYTGVRGDHKYGDVVDMGTVHFGMQLLNKKDSPEGSRILSRVNGRPFVAFDMNKMEQSKEDGSVYIIEGYAPIIDTPITRDDVSYLRYMKGMGEDESFTVRKALEQLKNIWD
ncbi:MAG: hypothetical protein K2O04_06930 [Clostridiales bacterium]|nr:hypothetical protein [Clostridiales bacterium]